MQKEQLLECALRLYDFTRPRAEVIRHNENITCKITDDAGCYVLRIHKPIEGFSLGIFEMPDRMAYIESELDMISGLNDVRDLCMQTPVCGKNGKPVQNLPDGTPVSALTWVEGQPVDGLDSTPELLQQMGKTAARMHLFFQEHANRYAALARHHYDQTLLPAIAAAIGSAVRSEAIDAQQGQGIVGALDEMCRRFDKLDGLEESLLVHADLSKSNLIQTASGTLAPIDFSLSGYSHFYMDIGGLFGHVNGDKERNCILDGYRSVRDCAIDPYFIEPYFVLQVVLFIACQYHRAAAWDWFGGKVTQWCEEIFVPFAGGKDLSLL